MELQKYDVNIVLECKFDVYLGIDDVARDSFTGLG